MQESGDEVGFSFEKLGFGHNDGLRIGQITDAEIHKLIITFALGVLRKSRCEHRSVDAPGYQACVEIRQPVELDEDDPISGVV